MGERRARGLGTGGGKTHTAAQLLREETGPVVFAAHLDSLVGDTAARLPAVLVR